MFPSSWLGSLAQGIIGVQSLCLLFLSCWGLLHAPTPPELRGCVP